MLDSIERVGGRFLLNIHIQQFPRCPACGRHSRSRHSTYLRRLRDLPWQGCEVELRLKARRFRCHNRACTRTIFAEPIPEVARSHARWTTRVSEIIRLIGYTAGGLPGSRILDRLPIPHQRRYCSWNREGFRQRLRRLASMIGRKGQGYGTILVDLDRRQVIDLLPDRSVESLRVWLGEASGVEVISRDRCRTYAEATANAVQVADWFHLFLDLSTAIEKALEERSRELCFPDPAPEQETVQASPPSQPRTTLESNENNCAASADMSATSEWLNSIDWATHNGPAALRSASSAKPFAAGYAPVSFPSGSRGPPLQPRPRVP